MNKNIKMGASMLALAAATIMAVAPANAQWHGRHHHHYHGGGGAAIAGFATGAIIGGALASRPYYNNYGYAYAPGGYYAGGGGDDAVSYCMSRFKSYDPELGTYLGYDGARHACP